MALKVVENKKDLLKVSFTNIDQGFMNVVKDKLLEDKTTEIAGFKVIHPEAGDLLFTLKTKGKDAKKSWNDALTSLSKDVKSFETEIKKLK